MPQWNDSVRCVVGTEARNPRALGYIAKPDSTSLHFIPTAAYLIALVEKTEYEMGSRQPTAIRWSDAIARVLAQYETEANFAAANRLYCPTAFLVVPSDHTFVVSIGRPDQFAYDLVFRPSLFWITDTLRYLLNTPPSEQKTAAQFQEKFSAYQSAQRQRCSHISPP